VGSGIFLVFTLYNYVKNPNQRSEESMLGILAGYWLNQNQQDTSVCSSLAFSAASVTDSPIVYTGIRHFATFSQVADSIGVYSDTVAA
jgi:hypothetical protein